MSDATQSPSNDSAIPYVPALEGLRGVAILLVLTTHFGAVSGIAGVGPSWAGPWLERVFYVGWAGVDLFFVLSGFLITSILLSTRAHTEYYQRFYARRVLRILPIYVLAVAGAYLLVPRLWPEHVPWLLADAQGQSIWFWTYTVNIANAFGWMVNAGVLAQMWSLAIEEQFYLAWPFIVRRASAERLLWLCLAMIAGALLLRLVWIAQTSPAGWPGPYRFTFTRFDGLAVGAAIAVARTQERLRLPLDTWARRALPATLAMLALWFVLGLRFYPDQPGVVTYGHSLLALCFGSLVVVALRTVPPRWMVSGPLRAMGKYSYGTYVWHWPLQMVFVATYRGQWHPAVFVTAGVLGSLLLGALSYLVVERPFLRMKTAFRYSA